MWYKVYFLVFASSAALSVILTSVAGWAARKAGIMDIPSSRKIHRQPIPLLGGLGIFLSFLLTIAAGITAARMGLLPGTMRIYLPGIEGSIKKLAAIALGGAIVVAFGLVDDIKGIKPLQKLLLQAIASVILFAEGIRISFFLPTIFHSFVLTVAWLILIMNSFNLMDNMDGLSAGVAFITGAILLVFALQMGHLFIATVLSVFLGSLAGFLFHNLPPARIFMGECGSSFIGFFLAASSILMTFYKYREPQSFLPLFAPLVIFSILFFDTASVIIIRIRRKLPVFKADKNHLSHRLVSLGMSQKQAVLFIYMLTICTGIGALLLKSLDVRGGLLVLAQVFIILNLVGILETVGRSSAGTGERKAGPQK